MSSLDSAPGDLFGAVQRGRMLLALLAVGTVFSIITLVVAVVHKSATVVALEAALLAVKLVGIVVIARRPAVPLGQASAWVAFGTISNAVSNELYPGTFRPFTGGLMLVVVFVCWFLPRREMLYQLALAAAAGASTLVDANPRGEDALRLLTLTTTATAVAIACRALRRRYEQLSAQATLDPLTGIGNRRAYERELTGALAHARRFGEPLALVYLDLDGFKHLNDTHGHPAGDSELQRVAHLLATRSREQDAVFRLGGDEFALLLPGTGCEGAVQLADELTAGAPGELRTTLTAGIAAHPEHGDTSTQLERAADDALLAGKRAGKQRVAVAGSA